MRVWLRQWFIGLLVVGIPLTFAVGLWWLIHAFPASVPYLIGTWVAYVGSIGLRLVGLWFERKMLP